MADVYDAGSTVDSHPTAKGLAVQLKDIRKRLPLRVLSPADWEHWTRWGYVIVNAAVPTENIRRLVDLLWEFSEMSPTDPSTWSRKQLRDHQMQELNNSGMVEIYNHQYLWDNRQAPRVYDAFVDIWDRTDLWVAIDRANLNTPNREGRTFTGFIHWDVDTSLTPLPIGVQGVLVAGRYRQRDRRLSMCAGAVLRARRLENHAARRSQSDASGSDRVRGGQCANEGRRPSDLQQPARAWHPAERVHPIGCGSLNTFRCFPPTSRTSLSATPASGAGVNASRRGDRPSPATREGGNEPVMPRPG